MLLLQRASIFRSGPTTATIKVEKPHHPPQNQIPVRTNATVKFMSYCISLESNRESKLSISLKCMSGSGDTEFSSASPPDVIIVGAGVAGSALAHTLGKVNAHN